MNVLQNVIASYRHIPYTWKHKMTVLKLEKKFKGYNTVRCYLHDCDKILMYIFIPFLGTRKIKDIHRKLSMHHHYNEGHLMPRSICEEIVLDWESARYTKPDKPENARQTAIKYHPEMLPYIESILLDWNL